MEPLTLGSGMIKVDSVAVMVGEKDGVRVLVIVPVRVIVSVAESVIDPVTGVIDGVRLVDALTEGDTVIVTLTEANTLGLILGLLVRVCVRV